MTSDRSKDNMRTFYVILFLCFTRIVGAYLNPISFPNRFGGSRSNCLASQTTKEQRNDITSPLISTPPRRIGVIIEPTPFTHVSGYSNRFKEMFKYLNKAKDKVEIITMDDTQNPPDSFEGYKIKTIEGFRLPLYKEICLSFDRKFQILKSFREFKPDLIHCSAPGFIVFKALHAARQLNVPIIMSYHTHLPLYARLYLKPLPGWLSEWIFWTIVRKVLLKTDLILVTSPQMEADFRAHGMNQVATWKKGVDFEKFNPKHKSESMRFELSDGHPTDPLLIYVGRFGEEKRLINLKKVLETVPNARLALVGTGPDEKRLRKFFAGTRTKFMGLMHGEKLSQAFASADLFVMPSDTETLGFVVIESLASGVPVVASRAGGIPSIIEDDKTGLLADPGNQTDFANKVKLLLDDRQKLGAMGEAGHEEMQKHSWESATAHLRNDLYDLAHENFVKRKNKPPKKWFFF